MAEHVHGIFRFVDPPDAAALAQCIDVINKCSYPWKRCLPELATESNGKVTVLWGDSGQSNTGTYHTIHPSAGKNVITLNDRYGTTNYAFTLLHEAGHMVDDTALRADQRQALMSKWHEDLDGRWDGNIQNGKEIEWSHNEPHTHSRYGAGWNVNDATYYHRPNEAFADAFVVCFAPTFFPYSRFAHWSDDYAAVRSIILSELTPPPPPPPTFPNDSVYRLYRAYFMREPDRGGYDHWIALLKSGYPLDKAANDFALSAEFTMRYGSLSNDAFVRLIYRNVLSREPDSGGYAFWMNHLNNKVTRGKVMLGFSESEEFCNKIDSERS